MSSADSSILSSSTMFARNIYQAIFFTDVRKKKSCTVTQILKSCKPIVPGIGTARSSSDVGRDCCCSRPGIFDGLNRQFYLWFIVINHCISDSYDDMEIFTPALLNLSKQRSEFWLGLRVAVSSVIAGPLLERTLQFVWLPSQYFLRISVSVSR